jgi:GntR family transcriptional regulator
MQNLAKWEQIALDIQAQIARGDLRPGDRVDTEDVLAEKWDVHRGTARRALVDLTTRGVLSPGSPRRVANWRPVTVHITRTEDRTHPGESPALGADSWVADTQAAGLEPAQDIDVAVAEAPAEAAGWLGIQPGFLVVTRRLVRRADGHPQNMITFWFPRKIAAGTVLAEKASITEGSLAWLEKQHGPLSHQVEVTSRMPTPDEARTLGIPLGVPVTVVWRRSLAPVTAQPLVASLAIYPADRTRLLL